MSLMESGAAESLFGLPGHLLFEDLMNTKNRIRGSLFGLAIGDALGYPVEFSTSARPSNRIVHDMDLQDRNPDGTPCAHYSDDTQMTRCVAEGLIAGGDRTQQISKRFVDWSINPPGGHRAPGGACMFGCRNMARGGDPRTSGKPEPSGGGCGTAMRSAPYGWWFVAPCGPAAEDAQMTHNTRIGRASAAAVAAAVGCALRCEPKPGVQWTIAEAAYQAAINYCAETAHRIVHAMWLATPSGRGQHDPDYVLDLYRGWAGHEAVAASLYCFLSSPFNLRQAILLAVNSPGDSDSLGSITGAISGALLGLDAIPKNWVTGVERSGELMDLADRFYEARERKISANQNRAGTSGSSRL